MADDFGTWLSKLWNGSVTDMAPEGAKLGQNVNTYTQSVFDAIQKAFNNTTPTAAQTNVNNIANALEGQAGKINTQGDTTGGIFKNIYTQANSTDPTSALRSLFASGGANSPSMVDSLQGLASKLTDAFGTDMQAYARNQSAKNMQDISQRYAGQGLGRSGAGLAAIASGSQEPLLKALTDISAKRADIGTQLLTNALSSATTGQSDILRAISSGLGLQNDAYGTAANTLNAAGNQYGTVMNDQDTTQRAMAGILGQLADPSFSQGALKQTNGLSDYLLAATMGAASGAIGKSDSLMKALSDLIASMMPKVQ